MLIFEADKNKKIQMMVEAQGISNDKLKFTFVIDTGKVQYGFPCMFNEGRVEVDIPPLQDIISGLQSGSYMARLDVTGDGKYYLNPFNESVEIKQSPSIKKINIKSDDMTESIKMAISSLVEVHEAPVKEDIVDEGNAAYKAFFDKKLKKFGVSSPAELKGDQKKKFFDEVDKEWKGKKEKNEGKKTGISKFFDK